MTGEVLDPSTMALIGLSQGGSVFNVLQNSTNIRYRCVLARGERLSQSERSRKSTTRRSYSRGIAA